VIRNIHLSYFRKHEDRRIDFSSGLVAIRAVNEGGKSSLIEAIAYAFFGTKALRTSIDEAVTWGHKPNELRVELLFGDYTFSRSKGGAEVIKDGRVFVTGQNEVSAFAAELLGAEVCVANNLMFANQGGLRGVLDSGPKGTGTLLESLAGLDIFDRLLDAASEKLTLGSPSVLESRLDGLRQQQANLQPPTRPNEAAVRGEVKRLEESYNLLEAQAASLSGILQTVQAQRDAEATKRDEAATITRRIDDLHARKEGMALVRPAGSLIDTTELETRISAAAEEDRVAAAWGKYAQVKQVEGHSRNLFNEMEASAKDDHAKAQLLKSEEVTKRAVLQSKLITSSVCGFCGQDVSQFPEVELQNAKTRAAIDTCTLLITQADTRMAELSALLSEYGAVRRRDNEIQVAGRIAYVEIDDTAIPAKLVWVGPERVSRPESVQYLKAKLSDIKQANQAYVAAEARYNTLVQERAKLETEADALQHRLRGITTLSDADFANLGATVADMSGQLAAVQQEMTNLRVQYQDVLAEHERVTTAWNQYQAQVEGINTALRQVEADLETLAFNNTLVKKVRAARPVVTNKLWGKVLAAVSTLFSQMRGEKSVVERSAKGFTVNGQAVESLSGSTLDILGLAIRVALTKTFMPACPFIILDEPGQGCDLNRVSAMLGFLAGCGYTQTILVTHDPVSEDFADHLIEL